MPTLDRSASPPPTACAAAPTCCSDARDGKPELILIASGAEVGLIVAAAERLAGEGIAVRCVSMPSWELFDALPQADRDAVLPPAVPCAAGGGGGVAARLAPLCRRSRRRARRGALRRIRAGRRDAREYGFTVDNVCKRARALLQRNSGDVMAHKFKVGDHVRWNSEAGHVSGKIIKVHARDSDWHGYTRHCSADDPQYEIKSDKTEHIAVHKGAALHKI